ncbi:calcium-binding protein [Avibacterium sp. 20-129]|uniref:calcium-binding protein n=1 Tax=Avibacterium sp. 20-129 TaxID=2911525 RepID=UPI002246338D|nr:calcium-binding protein [Avibacterium sp. 20-129]MCW9698052.1 hypothetical protein [Avibacterium sp. 20-129]
MTRDELKNNSIMKLYGTENNDIINDWQGSTTIFGGDGDDIINAVQGDDTLIGGQGNDILKGGFGADTYLFSKGHGQDTIFEDSNYSNREHDIDTLQFIDVNFDEVKFSRESNDLILFGYSENDSIRINKFYVHEDYQIDRFIFADKIVTRDELKNGNVMRLYGTNGDDEIIDWQGNSILIGEKGNDILRGNFGADTYLFSKGHGQDTIFEDGNYSNREHDIDTLQFIDVNFDEVKFSRESNDLILFGYSENDSIRINKFYAHEDYQIDRFTFADQALTRDELKNNSIMKLYGTENNDIINDWQGSTTIFGGDGDDIINAVQGDDTLIGGQGNDILKGGFGADTYLFSKGHGQDTIFEDSNYSNREHDIDTLQFIDVNFDDVKFSRESNDLILFGYSENDSIRINKFYAHEDYQIDRFIFADKIVTRDELKNGNVMRLYGTNGDDEIIDWQGNSILIGEKGNDILRGNFGADTYLFSKGHGQDTIFEDGNYSNREHDIDTLQFIDVNFDEVKFSRESNDLILFGYSENDSIRINKFYAHEDYQIDRFTFADQALTRDELKNNSIMKLYGTENNDIINDWQGSTTIFGGDGDDIINAVQGDDTLIGGQGNDILKGGFGADTYLLSKGHGQDTIFEDSNYSNRDYDIDNLIFTDIEDISDLYFSKNNNDLIIQSLLQKDKITIKDWYNHNDHKIEQIKFANSAELNIHQTEKLVKETMEILPQYTADNFSPLDLQQFKSHINQVIEVL